MRSFRPSLTGRSRASTRGVVSVGALAALVLAGSPAVPVAAAHDPHHGKIVSADPVNFTPHVNNGSVKSITQIGNKIVAVGTFTSVSQASDGSNPLTRNRIFAFDATTGAIDTSFNPNLDSDANSVATDGTHIYIAGGFNSVGGVAARKVAKLTASGQLVTRTGGGSLFPTPNGRVNDVVVRGSRVYIGGFFTSVAGSARGRLAGLNKDSGALLAEVNVPFDGVYDPAIGGTTNIKRFDVSPDGTKLVAVGNFGSVGGQARSQIAMLDLPAGAATVSSWATDRYDAAHNDCASVFDTFMRDIDFAPDSSYFAVNTTGAFAGGAHSGTLCDTASRWEAGRTGGGQQPTWVDYDGGDTLYGVEVTASAVYVGGHQRWMNNPFQGDQPGPGAVPRAGIAALDPVNGLPLSWNPGRDRGVGAEALHATAQGLWVGSDTERIGGELHKRIALMPLTGGKSIPAVAPAALPNDLFLAERTSCSQGGVLYRVNAGGPVLPEPDASDDWSTDDAYRNTGNGADWGSAAAVDSTVPACTTPNIFATERWDSGDAPEMQFNFLVTPGRDVKVRLYFADRCGCTSAVGSRVFDVSVEGRLVLDDFDINAQVGHDRGTMREFPVTSDGLVQIDFGHVVENPLVNGIEIIDASGAGPTAAPGKLSRQPVDASGSPTAAASPANSSIDWSEVRGSQAVNGLLYHGLGDGGFYKRTFDASTGTPGARQAVNLYDDPDDGTRIPFAIGSVTGSFYEPATSRLYYTVNGDDRLFYRYFTPESEVVGAQTFDVGAKPDFRAVSGMTLAGGKVLYGSSADGHLRSLPFSNGDVSGSSTTTSSDGTFRYREMFVP